MRTLFICICLLTYVLTVIAFVDCNNIHVNQPITPFLRSIVANGDGRHLNATFDIKSCNPFNVSLPGQCSRFSSSPVVFISSSNPLIINPGYTDYAFTILVLPGSDLDYTIETSLGSQTAAIYHAAVGQGVGYNMTLVPASIRLCTQPCPVNNPTALYYPPHPYLTTNVTGPTQSQCMVQFH